METERRILPSTEAGFRVEKRDDGKTYLRGTAIVFNKLSETIYGFREKIDPSACDGAEMDNIICKFNHDINEVLGTTWARTLTYNIDASGVHYEVELPETETGRTVKVLAERGDLRGNSFEFIPKEEQWNETREGDRTLYTRTILKFEGVYDFAPVMRPAYPDTNGSISIGQRSFENFKQSLASQDPDEQTPQEPPVKQDSRTRLIKLENNIY